MMPAHSASFTRMWKVLAGLAAYSLVVAWLDSRLFGKDHRDISSTLFAAFGTVLGLLLVFRTNTAYDRWWEGRKQWGELINHSRNFCIKLRWLPGVEASETQHVGRLLVNFARALKEHLREGIRARNLSIYQGAPPAAEPEHVPVHIAGQIRQLLASWRSNQRIDGYAEVLLDPHCRALLDVCGACERIRRTPLVQSYRAFIRRIIAVYLAALPWGAVANFGFWVPVVVVPVGYFMIGLERIAEEVEEPFGRGADDLMLDDYVRNIDKVVGEIFQDPSVQIPTSVLLGWERSQRLAIIAPP